ncbi:MAG: periplasmic protein CpxP/Spy [Acidobacteriota bacterium]|jgi:protein CpxP|nr:periplasmic protein CpxP/Spy [Acidobacteriota bacterium]
MKKFASAVAVTLLGASLAFAAAGEGHEGGNGWGRHGKRGGFGAKLAQELNLTDAQKAQIKSLKQASHEQNAAFFEQSRATMKQFFTAKKANDTATMEQLKPAMEANRAQMKQIRATEEASIASVLTPDQNAKWQQLKADRAARHQKREQQ